jgi:phosphoribosyl 1,2-cyclic phosphodiesterase
MSLFVKFWGTRGSIPTPGRRTARYGGNTSCLEVRSERSLFVCDGGTGVRELGIDLQRRFGKKPITAHLFFSHSHWDHIQGFPFFAPAYVPTNTLHLYSPSKKSRRIHDLLSGQMRSTYFPVRFGDLGGNLVADHLEKGEREIEGVRVSTFEQVHPGGSLAFRFEHQGRKVVYATDSEIDQLIIPGKAAAPSRHRLRRLPKALIDFCRDADLLICDAQYTDEEYPAKIGWGHPRASTVVDLAVQAEAKQLALSHHDPMHSDADLEAKVDACSERARKHNPSLVVFGAREGIELKL